MERKHVPRFNQDLELPLVFLILRKNLYWVLGVLLILSLLAFLYLRYTIPRYDALAVIQLTEDHSQLNFFDDKKMLNDQSIAQDIELLRSQVFIQRIVDSLPMEITYFKEGRILNMDNYNMAPYRVDVISVDPVVYGIPISIKFNNFNSYTLKYRLNSEKFEFPFTTGKMEITPHFKLLVNVLDSNACIDPPKPYYFVFNSPTDLYDNLKSKLKITVQSEAARTIKIYYTDVNAFRASDVANRVAKEFANFNLEKKREGVNNIIAYIDNTLEHVKLNLNEADSSLQRFVQEHRIVTEQDKENPIQDKNIQLVSQLQNQKLEFDIQMIILNDVIRNVNKQDIDIYEVLTQMSQLKSDLYVMGLVNNINLLIAKRDRLTVSLTDNHPDVKAVKEEIEGQRQLLVRSLDNIKKSTQAKIDELSANIRRIESTYMIESANLPFQMEYLQRKRYFEVNQTYYDLLIEKRVEYDLISKGYTSGYRILQHSTPSKKPVYPRQILVIIGVLGVWFLISATGLTLRYLSHDTIMDIEHITKYCKVPVLGVVNKYKSDIPVSQLVVDKKPKSLIAESFRNIRANLDFISNNPNARLVAVTSTISGEGKTFVSINLAGILAFTGKKVIIIDADMRKPKIHVGFNVSNEKGLSNLLIGRIKLDDAIIHSTLENLHFITAGPIPPNPSELLLSESMNNLIAELEKMYDYVVIDNPPVGIVTDAMALLNKADYPIYVFRAGVSRKFFVNNLQKLIFDNKIKNISIVLNGMDHKGGKTYGYGYGYGYGNYGYTTSGYGYYDDEVRKKRRKISLRRNK